MGGEDRQQGGFLLLQPGPRKKEEPTGDDDLLGYYNLRKIFDYAVALQPQNYLRNIAGGVELRRGRGMELAPLADVFASAHKPAIEPLPADVMASAFSLEPGTFAVPQELLGEPCVTTMRPEASVSGVDPGEGREGKRKKKDKKEKKKKRKREGSAEAGAA